MRIIFVVIGLSSVTFAAIPKKQNEIKNPYDWMRQNTEADTSGMTRVLVDLNFDGKEELLLAPNSLLGNGGGPFEIFEKSDSGYRDVGTIGINPAGFQVLKAKHHGFADVLAYWHMSAFDGELINYEYDGKTYLQKRKRKIKSSDFKDMIKPTEVKTDRTENPNDWN